MTVLADARRSSATGVTRRWCVVLAVAGGVCVLAGCGSSSHGVSSLGSPTSAGGATSIANGSGGGGLYGSGSGATSAASTAMLGTRHTALGTFLVDGTGRTLYLFEADRTTHSTCTAACATAWPPLLTAGGTMPTGAAGVQGGLIGASTRADGTTQVTYAGHPLYRYADDTAPGTTHGQGSSAFGAKWYVVAPSGKKIDTD